MGQTAGIEEPIRKSKVKSSLIYLDKLIDKIVEAFVNLFIGYPARFVAWIVLKIATRIANKRALNAKIDPAKIKCPACGFVGHGTLKLIQTLGPEKVALEYNCLICSALSYQATLRPAELWYSKPAEAPQKGR